MGEVTIPQEMAMQILNKLNANELAINGLSEKVSGYIELAKERDKNREKNCEAHMTDLEDQGKRLRVLEDWKAAENGITGFIWRMAPLLVSAIALWKTLTK